MKRWISLVLTLAMLFSLALTTASAVEPAAFTDVAEGAWYEDAVAYVCEKGLMNGTGAETFAPDGALTRAQLVTILWRLAGEPVVNFALPYEDVAEELWYTEAARWAAAEKIAEKTVGAFAPGETLERDEAILLLWNTAKYLGVDVSVGEDTNILSYNDAFDIREGRAAALQWAVGSGLVNGTGNGNLGVREPLTRAQAAALLQRFLRAQAPLSLWAENAPLRTALIDYVAAVTDEDGEDFIPVRDRIAVFDMDGTLFCETDPNYFDYTLLAYRVLDDPDYKDRASEFEREVANKIREQNETGKSFSGLEIDHGKAVASAFAGMTVEEFNAYIQEFKEQPMPSYEGMNRGGGFYRPMVQVVEYLQANDFTVYIISGTDRLIARGIFCNNMLDIPNRFIIGSDEKIVSSGQGDTNGLNHVFQNGEDLILGGEFLLKNLQMNKVSVIMREIGQQPVLSFGNSTGDSSMCNYVLSENPYRSLAFMLCCDDLERENGNLSKAEKMLNLSKEYGWIPVSMKNDWVTIYGEGVTYLGAAKALEPAA